MCSFFKFWFNTDAWFSIVLKSSSPLATFFFSLPSMVYLEESSFFFFFLSVALSCCLIHCFFQGSLNFPFSCLPRLCDEMATTTWGSLNVSGAASGRKLETSWGSLQLYISVISTIFLPWPLYFLFGHRLHDPKFSKALKCMSILSRKAVRNELGSHWNDFLRISVKPFLPVSTFPPVPSECLSSPYQFACQTFQLILFPVTLVPPFPQTSSLCPLRCRIIYLYPELLHICPRYPDPVVPVLRAYWWGSTGD